MRQGLAIGRQGDVQRPEVGQEGRVLFDLVTQAGGLLAGQHLHTDHRLPLRRVTVQHANHILVTHALGGNGNTQQLAHGIVARVHRPLGIVTVHRRAQAAVPGQRERTAAHRPGQHLEHRGLQRRRLVAGDHRPGQHEHGDDQQATDQPHAHQRPVHGPGRGTGGGGWLRGRRHHLPPAVPNTRGWISPSMWGETALASRMAYITPSGMPPHRRMTVTSTPISTP